MISFYTALYSQFNMISPSTTPKKAVKHREANTIKKTRFLKPTTYKHVEFNLLLLSTILQNKRLIISLNNIKFKDLLPIKEIKSL
jgi:hypothetical protein